MGPEEQKFEYEYKALIQELELTSKVKVESLFVYSDSQLVVEQVKSNYKAKELNMVKYLTKVKQMVS